MADDGGGGPGSRGTPTVAKASDEQIRRTLVEHHRVATLLGHYCRAVDAKDLEAVCELLDGADVDFRGTHLDGSGIRDLYRTAFAQPTLTAHCIANLTVDASPGQEPTASPEPAPARQVRYRATYQRYHLTDQGPTLAAVGFYRGTVDLSSAGLAWRTHDVRAHAES